MNSRIHIEDNDFALDDGLLPKNLAQGSVLQQFQVIAQYAGLSLKQVNDIFAVLTSGTDKVEELLAASFLNEKTKRNYWQAYQGRLKKLTQL